MASFDKICEYKLQIESSNVPTKPRYDVIGIDVIDDVPPAECHG